MVGMELKTDGAGTDNPVLAETADKGFGIGFDDELVAQDVRDKEADVPPQQISQLGSFAVYATSEVQFQSSHIPAPRLAGQRAE